MLTATQSEPPAAATFRATRDETRARLGLRDAPTLLILPPITPAMDALHALWAALIVSKVVPDLHILIPDQGPEVERLYRFAVANQTVDRIRFTDDHLSLIELIGAADVAVWAPARSLPVAARDWAIAAGLPVIERGGTAGRVIDTAWQILTAISPR